MDNVVTVRGVKIGDGRPKICVPIVGKTSEEIIEEAMNLEKQKIDLVEWRVDFYEDVKDLDKVKNTLYKLRNIVLELPILFTLRSKKEGGEKDISVSYYTQLNKEICKTKLIDLVDVELFIGEETVKDIVDYAHDNDIKVVISNHDFEKTPNSEEILSRLCKMQDLNADLPKIAVMPTNAKDVLTLLLATEEMSVKYATKPIITMSMGRLGLISRLSGEIFGSAITFGAVKKASAPGQVKVDELYNVLDLIHNNK